MSDYGFNDAAAPTPEQLGKIFNMPLGDMMEKLGIITPAQVAESGRKQAYMIVIRDEIKAGRIAADDDAIPQFKGAPDFLGLASKSEDALEGMCKVKGIPHEAFEAAEILVNTRQGVNKQDEQFPVPFIGMIHNKLYGNVALTQASLCIQQAIRASETALRLQEGTADPAAHSKKREFNFPNDKDDARVRYAVELHRKLSTLESATIPGTKINIADLKGLLPAVFADAVGLFTAAGKPDIATQVRSVATFYAARINGTLSAAPAAPATGAGASPAP
jgi:hypothetical protein